MIPQDRLSTTPVVRGYIDSFYTGSPLKDVEFGGVALNDPSQGLLVKPWTVEYKRQSNNVVVSADGVAPIVLFTRPDISSVSLAFDRNMSPVVAFVQAGQAKMYYYDDLSAQFIFQETLLGAAVDPHVTHDDKRHAQSDKSDVICAYVRNGSLYYRQQRDRYLTERLLQAGVTRLFHVGMNAGYRLQFMAETAGAPNAPLLADVVSDLCRKAGVPAQNINVDELYEDRVPGLRVAIDEGLHEPLQWLRDVFFFDKAQYDRVLHFPKRGRQPVVRIPYSDLVRGNPEALKQTLADETKLPRQVHINHLDPDGGYSKNKQTAARRSNLVNARGQKTMDTQVVLTADQAATAVWTEIKRQWNELIVYDFSTTIKYTEVTDADVVEVEDARGTWHPIRIEEKNEDTNVIKFEGRRDGGVRVYGSKLIGNPLPPPVSTTPGVIGPTEVEILNIPVLRDQNDELGVYVAATGSSTAWTGYTLYYSIDGGVSYIEAYTSTQPSIIGETLTDLLPEISYEYQDSQSFEVLTNFALASVSRDQLMQRQNLVVVGNEILQYQTAVLIGMVDTKFHYRLSGLIRARFSTTPATWPMGTRFVFLDPSVIFAQLQRSFLGNDITYKAVSAGLSLDETDDAVFSFAQGISQTEWPVDDVMTTRDGSDNVTVTWIGAARLGFDSSPYHSKYMRGYRVKFSNGHVIDVPKETQIVTYNSAPVGVTVTVCALNEITGEGPASAPLAT